MSEFVDRAKYILTRPLTIAFLIGLLIRVLLIPLALMFDSNFWAIVIRNMEAGYGLYGLEGYYYTPVWGYILGFVSGIQNIFFDIGDLSVVDYPFYIYRTEGQFSYSPNVTSIAFMVLLKGILFISDLLISILLYKIVKERTGDEKKALLAFILTFICPAIIGSSAIIIMPDTISAAFTLLTIVLLKKDKPLLAGFCYSFAVWTKFFPIAICLLLICYIFARHKDDIKESWRQTVLALSGFVVMSVVIFIPQILEGSLDRTFNFLTSRLGFLTSGNTIMIIGAVVAIAVLIFVFVLIGRHMCRCGKNVDDMFMEYSLVILAACMLMFTNVQYLVTLIPFLVYCLLVRTDYYKWVWIALAICAIVIVLVLNTNATMLGSLSYYTDLFSVDQVISLFHFFNDDISAGSSLADILCAIFNTIMKWSVFAIIVIFVGVRLIPKIRKVRAGE